MSLNSPGRSFVSRRSFCKTGLFAAGAVACHSLSASVLRASSPAPSAVDPTLALFVQSYASAYFLQGGSVLGAQRGAEAGDVHLVARLGAAGALASVQPRRLASMVRANGNFLSFNDTQGRFVTLENLLPADYAARQQELASGANIRFAHEALTYTPATAAVGDPFGAMGRAAVRRLQLLPRAAADPVGTVLHGLVEAARFGLATDGSFAALRNQTLTAPATSQEAARTAAMVVTALPALAAAGAGNTITDLLGTPRLASSLATAYGITASRAVRNYQLLRTNTDASFSDGSVWLATLLGKTLQQGTAGLAVAGADPYMAEQARLAMSDAREIASQVTFL